MIKIPSFLPSFRNFNPVRFFSHAISFETVSQLSKRWNCVETSLRSKGYALLQGPNSKIGTLGQVASLFGTAQKHLRNHQTGITDIIDESCQNKKTQVASNGEFLPHTDGTYLNGMIRSKEGKYFRVGPPKFILLQCIQPASDGGGTNILVDGEMILHSMIEKEPELLSSVFSPISIMRGDHLVLDVPIFKTLPSGFYALRFSYDSDMYFPKKMGVQLARFNERYISNSEYMTLKHLKEGEILVIDNLRSLHARTAFVGERHLRRLWIHDDTESEEFINPQGDLYYKSDIPATSPTAKYETYGPVSDPSLSAKSIQAGIYIPPHLKRVLDFHVLRKGIEPI